MEGWAGTGTTAEAAGGPRNQRPFLSLQLTLLFPSLGRSVEHVNPQPFTLIFPTLPCQEGPKNQGFWASMPCRGLPFSWLSTHRPLSSFCLCPFPGDREDHS